MLHTHNTLYLCGCNTFCTYWFNFEHSVVQTNITMRINVTKIEHVHNWQQFYFVKFSVKFVLHNIRIHSFLRNTNSVLILGVFARFHNKLSCLSPSISLILILILLNGFICKMSKILKCYHLFVKYFSYILHHTYNVGINLNNNQCKTCKNDVV